MKQAQEFTKNKLKEEHGGAYAVEWVLLTPLVFLTFMFLLYMFFLSLAYISLSNTANIVARDLDLRNEGILQAENNSPSANNLLLTWMPSNSTGGWKQGYIPASSITIAGDAYHQKVLYQILADNQNRFLIPFAQVTSIKVEGSQYLALNASEYGQAGTTLYVEITYKVPIVGSAAFLTMRTSGYNIIT